MLGEVQLGGRVGDVEVMYNLYTCAKMTRLGVYDVVVW